jgi:coproporphyrinogen III oxidase
MWVIATGMTCRGIGGIYVDEEKRKEELVKMIESIKDADTIKYLHTFIKTFLEEWG